MPNLKFFRQIGLFLKTKMSELSKSCS